MWLVGCSLFTVGLASPKKKKKKSPCEKVLHESLWSGFCAVIQCISATPRGTRWVHMSPEGYINKHTRASLTPALLFISLKVRVCVCVCALWIFHLCGEEVNLIPEAFFKPHMQYHEHAHIQARLQEGMEVITLREAKTRSGFQLMRSGSKLPLCSGRHVCTNIRKCQKICSNRNI